MKNLIILFGVFYLVTSCKKEGNIADKENHEVVEIQLPEAEVSYEPASSPQENISESIDLKEEVQEQKIIKNASLRFETSNVSETAKSIIKIVNKYKGFVVKDNESKDYGTFTRNIILRVPNKYFDNVVNESTKGITHFDEKLITSVDVTSDYIDVEARLKAKRELETRYLQLLTKANKVTDMLEIEKELSSIREEIESKEMMLKHYQNKVSFSTIEYTFYQPTVSSGTTVSYGDKVVNSLKSSVNWIPGFGLWIISVWPFLLLFVCLFFYFIRKKKKKSSDNL